MVAIDIDTWTIKQFIDSEADRTLDLSPEYQRRPVWKERDKILLIDSIVRQLPIGAITLYESRHPDGYHIYEVIDGKQRLSAIVDFCKNSFQLKSAIIRRTIEDDDDELPFEEAASTFYDRDWGSLTHPERLKIFQYRIPVFIVKGERDKAIFAFYRMNKSAYALKPQEIRNAVFNRSEFLRTVIALERRLADDLTDGQPYFSYIGAVSRNSLERMQDIQFLSELLILIMAGPQHRRDTIDQYYRVYKDGPKADLDAAAAELAAILEQILFLFNSAPLQSWHFPSNCENDFYAIVGAFKQHGKISKSQFDQHKDELALVISEFRRQVGLFVEASRTREIEPNEFLPEAEEYGRTFFGGQINGLHRREARIGILRKLIDDIVVPLDERRGFTEIQRRIIWSLSSDKICARCGQRVGWEDYEAGHKVAHALGGRTTVENGQIEHRVCNRRAGAKE